MNICITSSSQNNNDIVIFKKNLVISKKYEIYNLLEEINKLNNEINEIKTELNKICSHCWIKDTDNIDFSTKYVCKYCDC